MKTQNTNTTTHGNSKSVIDLTTGITYNSLREAAEAMGVHISAISLVVRGKMKTCKGHRFCFAEENNTTVAVTEEFTPIKIKARRGDTLKKKVKDMTTGEVYESITEAAKALGVHRSAVGYAANGNIKTCKKHVFRFVDDLTTETTPHHQSIPVHKGKSVLCVTTGEVYRSAKEAAYVNNIKYSSVIASCKKGGTMCYLEDAPYRVMDIVTGARKQNLGKELAVLKNKQTNLLQYKAAYEKTKADIEVKQAEVLKELEELTEKINELESKLN